MTGMGYPSILNSLDTEIAVLTKLGIRVDQISEIELIRSSALNQGDSFKLSIKYTVVQLAGSSLAPPHSLAKAILLNQEGHPNCMRVEVHGKDGSIWMIRDFENHMDVFGERRGSVSIQSIAPAVIEASNLKFDKIRLKPKRNNLVRDEGDWKCTK